MKPQARSLGTGWRYTAIGLLMLLVENTAAFGEERAPVSLRIENGSENAGLRCQLVLAHFMTRDLAPAAPGRVIEIDLLRNLATGALWFAGAEGRLVPVENVLCGTGDDWAASRNDINLTPLRDGSTPHLQIICAERSGLSCTVAGKTKD
ncbi:MAG: hypothetical protein ACTSW2_05820 [Alphaproteobacteria bacterium]